jgi:phage gp36-like protein
MPLVGFEPTIPVFERAKTVRALDRAAAVIDRYLVYRHLVMTL